MISGVRATAVAPSQPFRRASLSMTRSNRRSSSGDLSMVCFVWRIVSSISPNTALDLESPEPNDHRSVAVWGGSTSNRRMRIRAGNLSVAALSLALIFSGEAHAAWFILKNEPDPIEPSRSVFVAMTPSEDGMGILGIRCLQGIPALMLTTHAADASKREPVDFKIVADRKPVQEITGSVLHTNGRATTFAFADASTLTYLRGAQRIWVRVQLAAWRFQYNLLRRRKLRRSCSKTLKACGAQANRAFASTASKRGADEARTEGGSSD